MSLSLPNFPKFPNVCSIYDLTWVIAGSLEAANSSIRDARNIFKDFDGEKIQDFMIIRWPISLFVY